MNIEIEIKAKVKDFIDLKKRLKKLGAKFIDSVHQIDTYYILDESWRQKVGPRLRIRQDLTHKKYCWEYHEPFGENQARENEVVIDNPKVGDYILKKMGCKLDVVIDKQREKYRLKDINIDLDKVKGLGNFIEVEIMNQKKSASLKRLKALLEILGVSKKDYGEYKTYLHLMWEKKGKKIIAC